MKIKKLLPLLFLIIPLLVGTQLFRNASSHVEVVDVAKELEFDNGKLESENKQLTKSNKSLKKQVHTLSKEVSSLKATNESLSKKTTKNKPKNEKNTATSTIGNEQKFDFKPIDLPDSEDN